MKKHKRSKWKILSSLNAYNDIPYLVFGGYVALGDRPNKAIKDRAFLAGLQPVTDAKMRKIFHAHTATWRIMNEGRWYDTLSYRWVRRPA